MTNYEKPKRFHIQTHKHTHRTFRQYRFFLIFFKITKIDEKKEYNFSHDYILKSFSIFFVGNEQVQPDLPSEAIK